MTTRRKRIKLRAYDYMEGMRIVVERLRARGEDGKLDRHEVDRIDVVVEVAADLGVPPEQAVAMMHEVADAIIMDRDRVLFAAFDERDSLGDDCAGSETVDEARRAVA